MAEEEGAPAGAAEGGLGPAGDEACARAPGEPPPTPPGTAVAGFAALAASDAPAAGTAPAAGADKPGVNRSISLQRSQGELVARAPPSVLTFVNDDSRSVEDEVFHPLVKGRQNGVELASEQPGRPFLREPTLLAEHRHPPRGWVESGRQLPRVEEGGGGPGHHGRLWRGERERLPYLRCKNARKREESVNGGVLGRETRG